jgi:putative ABC transport system permease protein
MVEGVFRDFPSESHVHFDIISSMSSFFSMMKEPDTWLWSPCWTYILIKDKIAPKEIEQKFPAFVKKYFDKDIRDYYSLYLQPITDIHLKSDLESEIEPNSKSLYIYILLIISVFLLLVSCLNFINLSIVGSFTRIREISIRKIMGSSRKLVVFQFIVEAVLTGLFSFVISLFLIEGLLPAFKLFTGNEIQMVSLFQNGLFFKIIALVVLIGFVVGTYTGLYASSFPVFNIGRFKYQYAKGKWFSGKILILVQYVISLIILIAVFINFRQLIFLKNSSLGFDKEKTLVLSIAYNPVANDYETFKAMLLQNHDIEAVTASDNVVGAQCSYRRYFFLQNGLTKAQFFPELIVRHDFIKTLGIELLNGNDFLKGTSEDVSPAVDEVIVNESMVRELGFESSEKAIRKKLFSFNGNEIIVGVIKDFNTHSLHNPIEPLVIRLSQNNYDAWEYTKFVFIKFRNPISKENLKYVGKQWKGIAPNWPFEPKYLDNILDEQYRDEESLNFFLWIFSVLIILIASMGVWVVSSLASIRKTKEIGIRKAIGALIRDILQLFLKDFTSILMIANLVAWPVSWFILKLWFTNFANHIGLHWLHFLYASLFILLLTLTILGWHALKVARSNTVDSLREE